MPYEIKQDPANSENWLVVNSETHEVKATHEPPDAKEKAEKQVKLLHAIENDPNWEPSDE